MEAESDNSEDMVSHFLQMNSDTESHVVKLEAEDAAAVHSAPELASGLHSSRGPSSPSDTKHIKTEPVADGAAPPESEAASGEKRTDGMDVDVDEEEDEEDEGNENDDASELSEGEDLRQDLEDALNDSNFSFTGNFYHANILTTAPNPCLHISDLGLVGLPLSERDAKSIISKATLSPFGHGERTVVDKDVRDTWEIPPDRLAFGNPEWSKYIDGVVCLEVCQALGVAIGNPPPKMHLYKLLLYETGSHFLPHQDTQKENGMFASVVIILPSAYTGGQVVVSHASTTKTIDFAPNSLLSTAVLSWYTDVKHEVKPITSGYRLALTYNLIHVASPGVSQPTVPDTDNSVYRITRILNKWRHGKYEEEPQTPLLAYLLDHQYSSQNLKDGFKALKGVDAHLVTFLRDIAEKLGFMIGLATLKRQVSGPGDDCESSYHRRSRHHYYSDSEDEDEPYDAPEMMEVGETSNSITGLVDLEGASMGPSGPIRLEDDNLIPTDPLEDESPDKVEYEGYMGNYGGDVTHWYHRTVLVLIHESDLDRVYFSAAGIPYAFQKLDALGADNSPSPSVDARLWIYRIVSESGRLNKEQALKLVDLAMKWKDVDVFKAVMNIPVCTLSVVNMDILSKAWKTMSFEAVQPSFEKALVSSLAFSEKIKLIYTVKSKMSNEDKPVVRSWCQTQTEKILASYTQFNVKDVPSVMFVIRNSGWSPFMKVLFPTVLKRSDTYIFLIALIKALQEARQSLLDRLEKPKATSQSSTSEPADTAIAETKEDEKTFVDKVIGRALEAAAKQWSDPLAATYAYTYSHVTPKGTLDRIIEIVNQAILSSNLEVCRTLFIDVLKKTGTSSEKFTQIYNPLIPRLRSHLQTMNQPLYAPPFVGLFQILIGVYLRDILGKKVQQSSLRLRKIGCGCDDCQPLDQFVLDPTTQKTIFRLVQKRRKHLEGRIAAASDLCTYEIIKYGSPHGVQVTKRPEVVQASTWDHRQKEARNFLSLFGTDEVIKKMMGARYSDVIAAVDGTTPFGAGKVPGNRSLVSTSNSTSSTATQKANAPGPAATATSGSGSSGRRIVAPSMQSVRPAGVPPQVAGKKRKDMC